MEELENIRCVKAGEMHGGKYDKFLEEPVSCASRGRPTAGGTNQQQIELNGTNANSITTVQKDSMVCEPPKQEQTYRIRALTERECFRLMGVKEEDYQKIASHQSRSSQTHLAGDSIVTTCLMAIFGEMFDNIDYRKRIEEVAEAAREGKTTEKRVAPKLTFRLITTAKERATAKHLVETYHSYVPSYRSVGRRIDWLIYANGELVGMIGIGSATYPPCKDLLKRLGISKQECAKIFNSIANNWRFCMIKHIPNAGTKILKFLRQNAPIAWKAKYGDELKYLMTFVGGGNNGAVYKADNWEVIGYTAGLPDHKACSMKWNTNDELRNRFVKPNGENRKIILFREL